MGALATQERVVTERAQTNHGASRLFEPGRVTLEDAILAVWRDLVADGRAACPVCGDSIAAESGCPGCGSELR
jgi:hypothetical protein